MNKIYHVAKTGNDFGTGFEDQPFKTINRAAKAALTGDKVIVHEGTYREWVKPMHSGYSEITRIIFEAAENEKVIIKGSEIINNWELFEGTTWKATIDNTVFGEYNPYEQTLYGDWFVYPNSHTEPPVHAGDVYLNGQSFFEARTIEEVLNPTIRESFETPLSGGKFEKIPNNENTLFQWHAQVNEFTTEIYANFHQYNPNEECTEINVRKCCFYPDKIGLNYITVRGFEMAQAATTWAPPTADQPGLLGAHWSKGWIIEDNIIHDAKCSAVSIGKEISTGHNICTRRQVKPGFQAQLEAVFRGIEIGWNKEKVGSHIVRNNTIYDCGQNGIVGHMGCAFSEIYGNHIYNIGTKYEFFGWEIAGIKFHAPLDTYIHDNYVHNCTLGLWLDWQTQGTRASRNVLHSNNRDCTIEVSHGPYLMDNNIFGSVYNFDNLAQGGAFINNFLGGVMRKGKVLGRSTPYHYPHSTTVAGCSLVYGNDDRFYNNIFLGHEENPVISKTQTAFFGTAGYDVCPASHEEYVDMVIAAGNGDLEKFVNIEQPVYIDGNVYYNGAEAYKREANNLVTAENPNFKIVQEGSEVFMEINIDEKVLALPTKIKTTESLGTVRIVDAIFDGPNGEMLTLDEDLLGNKRSEYPTVGAIEGLKVGYNKVKIWDTSKKY